MPCSICRLLGHNRATCPQNPELRSGRRVRHRRTVVAPLPSRPQSQEVVPSDNPSPRFRWFGSINKIIRLCKFIKIVDQFTLREMESGENDIREVYVSWLKVKTNPSDRIHLVEKCLRLMMGNILGMTGLNWLQNIRDKISKCIIFHNEINDSSNNSSNNDSRKRIDFMNLRTENYLVYWVVGNYLVQDLDEGINNIRYLGMIRHGLKFNVKTLDGHRFYLVPHRLDIEPPYHPQTDKEFFIEPYCEINIHEGTQKIIFIDNKESLSELNRWKFNALKLDYLVREIIKLGGKDNDMFGLILDLHDDIQLEEVSETIKDIAGIPSRMTNIT